MYKMRFAVSSAASSRISILCCQHAKLMSSHKGKTLHAKHLAFQVVYKSQDPICIQAYDLTA